MRFPFKNRIHFDNFNLQKYTSNSSIQECMNLKSFTDKQFNPSPTSWRKREFLFPFMFIIILSGYAPASRKIEKNLSNILTKYAIIRFVLRLTHETGTLQPVASFIYLQILGQNSLTQSPWRPHVNTTNLPVTA